jgi:hypothetical protein
MWKTHFIVVAKRVVFHSPCGNRCGNLGSNVENFFRSKVFHISTAPIVASLWKCGKLEVKLLRIKE